MALSPTTPDAIRDDFVTQILAISPAHSEYQSDKWADQESPDSVPGASMRGFFLETLQARPYLGDEGGIWGSGVRTKAFTIIVWASYRGLSPKHYAGVVDSDSDQLLHAFHARVNSMTGLYAVDETSQEWIEGDGSEDGQRWGGHTFEVVYLADTTT